MCQRKIKNTSIILCAIVAVVFALVIIDITKDEPPSELTLFREQCLHDELVTCEWNILESYLESHTVSRVWWNLTRDERYSIAEMAVTNTLYYRIPEWRSGESNCAGGAGGWSNARCQENAVIRYLKFGSTSPVNDDYFYYKNKDGIEQCFVPNTKFYLPCFTASSATYNTKPGDPTWGHHMNVIQIGEAKNDIDSYVFFHYSQFDLEVGGSAIPIYNYNNTAVVLFDVTKLITGGSYYGDVVAEWYFSN